ncbi:hypothetical protein BG004_007984 [Podila humilis]|nr:hypothetical protein BG004_007984 [Podila humilis]
MAGPSSGKVTKKPAASKSKSKSSTTNVSNTSTTSTYSGKAKGITQLPVARVKRIIKEDKDINMVSNDAVFLISMATELFLESFTAKAFNLAKMEKRKTIAYKDLATAVTQHDSLEFLQDVIPKTMTLKAALEKQRVAKENEDMGGLNNDNDDNDDDNGMEEDGEQPKQDGHTANGGAQLVDDGSDLSDAESSNSDSEEQDNKSTQEENDDGSGPDDMDED